MTIDEKRLRQRLTSEELKNADLRAKLGTVKRFLETMAGSASVYVDAEGNIMGYRIKTGALHKLFGLLECTGPINLPEISTACEHADDGRHECKHCDAAGFASDRGAEHGG